VEYLVSKKVNDKGQTVKVYTALNTKRRALVAICKELKMTKKQFHKGNKQLALARGESYQYDDKKKAYILKSLISEE